MNLNPQAKIINDTIGASAPQLLKLFSERGLQAFFPKEGIMAQTKEANGKRYNATIGVAMGDDGSPLRLESIAKLVELSPAEIFAYAPTAGDEKLRALWQASIREKNPSLDAAAEISLPVVAAGLTHALNIIGFLFVNAGDTIVTPDKFWGNYRLVFEHWHGGQLTPFPMFAEAGFNVSGLRDTLKQQPDKQLIFLNFPNNPTGYSPTTAEAQSLVAAIHESAEAGHQIAVICDDAYTRHFYSHDVFPESLFGLLANLHENVLAIKVDGATKEEYAWGLRIGFITFGFKGATQEVLAVLEQKVVGAIRGGVSSESRLSQSLLLRAVTDPLHDAQKAANVAVLQERFDEVSKILTDKKYVEYFKPLPFNSGYFLCLELRAGLDAEAIRQRLLKDFDTGVISIGNLLRVAFSSVAKKDLRQLFENIFEVCQQEAMKK